MQKNPPLNRPSEYKPPGGLYLEFALYRVQSKTKQKWVISFPLQASPADFITQISLRCQALLNVGPSKNKPLKKAL